MYIRFQFFVSRAVLRFAACPLCNTFTISNTNSFDSTQSKKWKSIGERNH
jgi:hypothetical protein